MREIKFRAWVKSLVDSETGMYYPLVLQLLGDGSVDRLWTNDYKFTSDTSSFVLMQYTGLKDKNGKEIYEGDIVKSEKEFNSYTGLNSDIYGGNVYEVKNNGWSFFLSPRSIYLPDKTSLEVIGNIYENKELLDG